MIIFIEAYISTVNLELLSNQVIMILMCNYNILSHAWIFYMQTITFKGELLEYPSSEDVIQFHLFHVQLQVQKCCELFSFIVFNLYLYGCFFFSLTPLLWNHQVL